MESLLRHLIGVIREGEYDDACLFEARKLLRKIDARRAQLPKVVPTQHLLIHTPVPFDVPFDKWVRVQQQPVEPVNRWFYYGDYAAHPHRCIQPFGYSTHELFRNVFALIVPNPKRVFSARRHNYREYTKIFPHCLCFDWIVPVNWQIDLHRRKIMHGPYSGKSVYTNFYKKGDVNCVQYAANYYNEHTPSEEPLGPRVCKVSWLMHLIPPYGLLSCE